MISLVAALIILATVFVVRYCSHARARQLAQLHRRRSDRMADAIGKN